MNTSQQIDYHGLFVGFIGAVLVLVVVLSIAAAFEAWQKRGGRR